VEDVAFTAIFTSVGSSTQYMVCWASSVRREILKPEAAVTGRIPVRKSVFPLWTPALLSALQLGSVGV
jgi:hypothetical protein